MSLLRLEKRGGYLLIIWTIGKGDLDNMKRFVKFLTIIKNSHSEDDNDTDSLDLKSSDG